MKGKVYAKCKQRLCTSSLKVDAEFTPQKGTERIRKGYARLTPSVSKVYASRHKSLRKVKVVNGYVKVSPKFTHSLGKG